MRIVFYGSPAESVPTLRSLRDAGHDIVRVITQPDRRRGRRGNLVEPTPVAKAAIELGLSVSYDPRDAIDLHAELGVLVAFGRIISQDVLEAQTIVNIHPSLLPRWRGATPVEAAILAGDEQTGVCLMQLTKGMDEGPIYWHTSCDLDQHTAASEVYAELFGTATKALVDMLSHGLPEPVAQVGEPTYCGKLTKDDRRLHWDRTATQNMRVIRIGDAWTTFRARRFRIVEAVVGACSHTSLEPGMVGNEIPCAERTTLLPIRVQPEGKPVLAYADWLRGARVVSGETFV